MQTTKLRKVGGSVMLAAPPALLELLQLEVGASVDIRIKDGRLVVTPRTRPRYSLDELLAQCDETAPAAAGERAWLDAQPVGHELLSGSGAPSGSSALIPLPAINNRGPGRS